MRTEGVGVLVLLVAGGPDEAALARAADRVRASLPGAEVRAVWVGDPQLGPRTGAVPVADAGEQLSEVDLVRADPAVVEWRGALRAVRAAVDAGAGATRVVVAWPAADVAEVRAAANTAGATVVLLARDGSPSVRCAAFGAHDATHDAVADLDRLLAAASPAALDQGDGDGDDDGENDGGCAAVERALAAFAGTRDDVVVHALEPADAHEGELAGGRGGGPGDPLRAPRLPGGVEIDATMRRAVALALVEGDDVPAPWTEAAAFRRWLATRWWSARRTARADLLAAFPGATMRAGSPFERWAAAAFVDDRAPFLLDRRAEPGREWHVAAALRRNGLNLVGYARHESGLGDDVRRLSRGLRDARVGCALLAYERTGSPLSADPPAIDDTIGFETTLAIVTAAQFPALAADHPELFAATRRMIGYWMWEIDHVPRSFRPAFDLVDEIWTGSQFIADAFSAVTSKPVRTVTIPVPEPVPSPRPRVSFPPLADAGERPVLLVVMDHFSVTERKNPVGAIRAFRRAFPVTAGDGPVLLVKTMNARHRWDAHQRLMFEADGRPDIRVWDAHLSRPDQMALVRAADVLVSLHRGEGLGLHLAEAMWLGVPTIATSWSGNLEFMDDDVACMVDATLVPIEHGEGIYPAHARWADPDLDVAADAMHRLVDSADLRRELGRRGRERMAARPSLAEIGRRIAELTKG